MGTPFSVLIGEHNKSWKGWRLECEGSSASGLPPGPNQPFVTNGVDPPLLVTRARAWYRDLAQHFETTWRPDGSTDGAVLVGDLAGITDREWKALGRGRILATKIPRNIGRPRENEIWAREFAEKWRTFEAEKHRRPKKREGPDLMSLSEDYFAWRYRNVIGVPWERYQPPPP